MTKRLLDETISLLCDLISIDSVNPSLVAAGAGEESISQAAAEHQRWSGLDVEITEVAPGRKQCGWSARRARTWQIVDALRSPGHGWHCIFGPGGEGYHGLEEYVWIDQVSACREVLARVARDFCQ
jgi:acetylornithine deacetylase/succinyl-diaminopimelate desuccinylase-like protein